MIIKHTTDVKRNTLYIPYTGGLDSRTMIELYKNYDYCFQGYSTYKSINLYQFLVKHETYFSGSEDDIYFYRYIHSNKFTEDFIPLIFMYVNPNDINAQDYNILDVFKKVLKVSNYSIGNDQIFKNNQLRDNEWNLWRYVWAKGMTPYLKPGDDLLYGITASDVVTDLHTIINFFNQSILMIGYDNDNISSLDAIRVLTPLREYNKLPIYHFLRTTSDTKKEDINTGGNLIDTNEAKDLDDDTVIKASLKSLRLEKIDQEYNLIQNNEITPALIKETLVSIDNCVDKWRIDRTNYLYNLDYYAKMNTFRKHLYNGNLEQAYKTLIKIRKTKIENIINFEPLMENLNLWIEIFGNKIDLKPTKNYIKDTLKNVK